MRDVREFVDKERLVSFEYDAQFDDLTQIDDTTLLFTAILRKFYDRFTE